MRVGAAEFIPAEVPASRPSVKLSAESPEFVPSSSPEFAYSYWAQAASQASLTAPTGGELATVDRGYGEHLGAEDGGGGGGCAEGTYAAGYVTSESGFGGEAGLVAALLSDQDSFVDAESFFTPQPIEAAELERAAEAEAAVEAATTTPEAALSEASPSAAEPAASQAPTPAPTQAAAAAVRPPPTSVVNTAAAVGVLQVEGRRLHWHVPRGWEELQTVVRGECLRSPPFRVAGVSPCQLALYPTGANLTADGHCAASLLCEEKSKLKFELFLNARSSGRKVLLGRTFSCDFRLPSSLSGGGSAVVGIEVHENLFYTGFR